MNRISYIFIISSIALIFNILKIHFTFAGFIFLFTFFVSAGYLLSNAVRSVFGMQEDIFNVLIGIFLVFSSISFAGSIVIIFYKFNEIILSLIIIIVTLSIFYINRISENRVDEERNRKSQDSQLLDFFKKIDFNSYYVPFYIILFLLFFIGAEALFLSASPKEHIMSPWEVIPDKFIWVIFILSIQILFLTFFKSKKWILVLIIAFSLLLHLYIPAVYRVPYGLDDWRHIGSQEKINRLGDVGFTDTITSYAAFWTGALFLEKSLSIDFVHITVWWNYILFSIFVPLFMYILLDKSFSFVKKQKRIAINLFSSFIVLIFYPFQLYGSISLPVGFGFLFFLFFLITVFRWFESGENQKIKYILFVEFLFMFFSYVIYLLISFLILGFLAAYKFTRNYGSKTAFFARVSYTFFGVIFIPVLSLFVGPKSKFDFGTLDIHYFKDFWVHYIQYLFGIKAISNPRPQAGNLIWHDMRKMFVDIFPFNWQYFDSLLLIILLVLIIFGALKLGNRRNFRILYAPLSIFLLFISLGGIFLDRYYLGGIHLLTERLDLVFDLSVSFVLVFCVYYIFSKIKTRALCKVSKVIIVVFFSFVLSSVYISGPVYGRATASHYKAVKKLYEYMKSTNTLDYCVLAEHFPLAALEAASRGEIINGNFTIKYGYLEDNGRIFIKMFTDPKIMWLDYAVKISSNPLSGGCYFVLDSRFMAYWSYGAMRSLLGEPIINIDDVYVWRYDKVRN